MPKKTLLFLMQNNSIIKEMKNSICFLFSSSCLLISILTACVKKEVPTVSTIEVTEITATSALSGGIISNDGNDRIISCGVCWNTVGEPTIGNSKTNDNSISGSFTSNLTNLEGGTLYYVKAYATNSEGTGYGVTISFSTLGQVPTATTEGATDITTNSATLNSTVNAYYLSTIIIFEYGTTVNYGSSTVATQSPLIGNTDTNVNAIITGLNPGTLYHYRIKATNALGTTYGSDLTFISSISDVDGNIYKIVSIGDQLWIAENLKTSKYNDNTSIPMISDSTVWCNLTTPAFCWYKNNYATYGIYGPLYNWHTVNTSKLCPTGWHVPSDEDWTTLTTYLGGESVAGNKLKESGVIHWINYDGWPSNGSTNETGFTALPGGGRYWDGSFNGVSKIGVFWSSTDDLGLNPWYRGMNVSNSQVGRGTVGFKNTAYSVRCIKD